MLRGVTVLTVIALVFGFVASGDAQTRQGRRVHVATTPTPAPAPAVAEAESAESESAPPPEVDAIRHLDRWNQKKARTALEQLNDKGVTTPGVDAAWGLLKAEEGELKEGLELLAKAAKADTADPALEFYRGEVLYWNQNLESAKTAWSAAAARAEKLLEANPESAPALYYRGAALVRLNRYEDARTVLLLAKENGFDPARSDYQIGLTYAFEEKWTDAVTAFDAALTEDSGLAYGYFFRGLVWKRLNRTDKMLNDLDRFLKLAPDAPDSDKARALLAAGQR